MSIKEPIEVTQREQALARMDELRRKANAPGGEVERNNARKAARDMKAYEEAFPMMNCEEDATARAVWAKALEWERERTGWPCDYE